MMARGGGRQDPPHSLKRAGRALQRSLQQQGTYYVRGGEGKRVAPLGCRHRGAAVHWYIDGSLVRAQHAAHPVRPVPAVVALPLQVLASWGELGSGNGQMDRPCGIALGGCSVCKPT